ncbi:MAG: LptF/LptG family permease [Chlamydiia bacterium]|nr:LptF/LptG family permease [Chlamydiia bacterium]
MYIYWRYLLINYLRVFILSCCSFLAILIVARLDEIAHFAALGAPLKTILLFILYQIPYIIPISVPISSLISSMILFSTLSSTNELTALRSSGISLGAILTPIMISAVLLSIGNFYITSELSTTSHLKTRKMVQDLLINSPLLLLQKAKVASLNGAYVQMSSLKNGQAAADLVIAVKNEKNHRLNLFLAKSLELEGDTLECKNVTIISSSPSSKEREGYDHLLIENQQKGATAAFTLGAFLRQKGWKIANDHLKLRLLKAKVEELKNCDNQKQFEIRKNLGKCRSDVVRRVSLAISPLSFTVLGISFGIGINRNQAKRGIVIVVLLAAISMISYFVAKEFDHSVIISSLFFLLPHFINTLVSGWKLNRISGGLE